MSCDQMNNRCDQVNNRGRSSVPGGELAVWLPLPCRQHVWPMPPCLLQAAGVLPQVVHPCYPRGVNVSIRLGRDVFDSPCTRSLRPARFDPQTEVSVVGAGDHGGCLASVRTLFSFNCSSSQCSFNGVARPHVRGGFMVRATARDTGCL